MTERFYSVAELIKSMDLPEEQKREQIDYIYARAQERRVGTEKIMDKPVPHQVDNTEVVPPVGI